MLIIHDSHILFPFQMAAKPLTSEAIALTEKKMDMTLGFMMIFLCLYFVNKIFFLTDYDDLLLFLSQMISLKCLRILQ